MKLLKKAGFPILAASIIGFKIAPNMAGEAVFNLSLAGLVVGGLLTVLGPFLGSGEKPAPLSPEEAAEVDRMVREFSGPTFEDKRRAAGGAPSWIYIVGILLIGAGFGLFMLGPNGVNHYTVGTFSMIPLGVALMLSGTFLYGSPATRRNMVRGALAGFSFLLIFAGIFMGVFIAAGAFDDGRRVFWAAVGVAMFLGGLPGAYYGLRYQQSAEGRAIGRELGFVDASGGGADGIHDSKGFMNGVEVLFNVEQAASSKNSGAHFRLDVLCRCANLAGVELSVKPEGPLGISFGDLPKVPDVPHWDYFEVRCSHPDAALRFLPGARKGGSVLNDGDGFRELVLKKGEMTALFIVDGYANTGFVRAALQQVSLLASKFA